MEELKKEEITNKNISESTPLLKEIECQNEKPSKPLINEENKENITNENYIETEKKIEGEETKEKPNETEPIIDPKK